jgi:hypothetical protein
MDSRSLSRLLVLTVVMAVGEFASSIAIAVENYADSQPAFAIAFGVLFLISAWLLRARRITAGVVLAGLLSVFEIVSFPSWQRHNAFDWASQTIFIALTLATLATVITVLVARRRVRASA